MALDAVVEKNALPFYPGTHVMDDPRFTGVVGRTGDDDADVGFRIGQRPNDDIARQIVCGIARWGESFALAFEVALEVSDPPVVDVRIGR